jgi:hypothetical protein
VEFPAEVFDEIPDGMVDVGHQCVACTGHDLRQRL